MFLSYRLTTNMTTAARISPNPTISGESQRRQ